MADKQTVSLNIKANLECEKCYKKIQKVLNKLKEKEKITKVDFDNPSNEVTVWGYFNQKQLAHKLRCKACVAIKDIEFEKLEAKREEKKPEVKKEEKKPDDKKPEEKKKADEKKPEEGKKEDKKPAGAGDEKKSEKPKEAKAAAAPSSTVNLQLTHTCGICYPWPCGDPSHWGGGAHPQWPAFPGHHQHQHPPWGGVVPAPKWPCGGPSYCSGCGTCCGGGWPAPPLQPMCCPGPSSCRGCKGCRIVQEGKFVYEEYPPSACAVM